MILVRHGQSHFNLHFSATRQDPGIVDAGLTETGIEQARAAGEILARRDIRRILASPFTRTLETTEVILEKLDLPVTIEPLVHEQASFSCDIGTPRSRLSDRWPAFDFADLAERWWPERETETELMARCNSFRTMMAEVEDWRHVLIVTHWGFIRGLTGQEVANAAVVSFDPDQA